MRLMALDHGLKRIGVAVCDASGLVARELCIIERKSKAEDFARLNQIAAEQLVEAIVIGLPHNPQAQPGQYTQADTVRLWKERFAQTTSLPIIFWDEQLTSQDARELAIRQRRKPRDPLDDLAARVILQSYLDALRDGLAEAPPGIR
ncbi:MAG: Holliday junction resolvase RuvX [Chloroflexi bacterium]|nr:Holliday junction resolvase RuvX [Chloroflexota bacterium]